MADVFFAELPEASSPEQMASAAETLWKRMGVAEMIDKDALVAVKQHLGEKGGTNFVPPLVGKRLGGRIRDAGGKPFITDSNTLYNGMRANAVDHLEVARQHGFTHEALGFPVIIADGLKGEAQVRLKGPGDVLDNVFLAGAGYMADAVVVLTHVTGHMLSAVGATIKNVAMGLAGRAGKLQQHHSAEPIFSAGACTACGLCAKHCPADAITVDKHAVLDLDKCIGCGECYAFCPHGAVSFEWSATSGDLQKRMAEYCLAFHREKQGKVVYLNFLTRITKNCDCMGTPEEFLPDVGVAGSYDPVAVDTATVDIIKKRFGRDVFREFWPQCEADVQVAYGERIGLGSRKYEIVPAG